ncbi:uncharacterized protein LOC126788318 [Argentina anserina]|uniref:uncharacterized protein LOC126788318 n=1 Tax=Argentina anserina TaxID=57926 RepID=UPI0021767401|nr:uncharacterized protein LOC126788318 [Potentilla anserina]
MEQVAKRRRIEEGGEESKPLFINAQLHCSEVSETMKASESGASMASSNKEEKKKKVTKPQFVPAKDDSKPVLQDPILRSDPIETEEAVLRLPPFSLRSGHQEA